MLGSWPDGRAPPIHLRPDPGSPCFRVIRCRPSQGGHAACFTPNGGNPSALWPRFSGRYASAVRRGSTKFRCARLTGERQGVRVPRNEGVTNHVSPRAVRRSSRGVRRSVGSGSCGRAVEHRKGTCPGCRGFRIGRRQHRWPRYGERSASPAVSENPCTHESLSSGPGRPPPHLGLSAGVAKGRQNCRSRRRTGRRSQTRS